MDWDERATERENIEVLQSLDNTSQKKLAMINATLKKIETGEYFNCSVYGVDILCACLELLLFSWLWVNCTDKLKDQ